MRTKPFFGWLTLDMVIFVAANYFLIEYFGDRFVGLESLNFLKLLILGLAAYRAANIVSNEPVTQPLRAPFVDETRKDGKMVEEPKKSGFMGAVGLLIYCPSCTGVWLSAALVYCYALWPNPTLLVALFLALSAVERIVCRVLEALKNLKKKT